MAETQFIIKRPPNALGASPFEGDLLSRQPIADRLTEFVNRLREGHVIGIHSPWGEGKTWFGLNWSEKLKKENYPTIWLDAFESDQLEDPFLALVSPIASLAKQRPSTESKHFLEKATKVGKRLAPFIVKNSIRIASRTALGTDALEEVKDILEGTSEDIENASEKWVERHLNDAEKEKSIFSSFQSALSEFAKAQEKPLVFFIDELDRCRPDFAVRLIEKVKHLFDVPNVVFVLLLNKNQMESAIRGLYGEHIDAHEYLSKFVHFFLNLPKRTPDEVGNHYQHEQFCNSFAKRLGIDNRKSTEDFIYSINLFGTQLGFSLRNFERAITLYALSGIDNSSIIAGWVIALKLKKPSTFHKLYLNDASAHQECINMLEEMHPYVNDRVSRAFSALHKTLIPGSQIDDAIRNDLEPLQYSLRIRTNIFRFIIDRIDLPIQ